jgi:hypothetical protein
MPFKIMWAVFDNVGGIKRHYIQNGLCTPSV